MRTIAFVTQKGGSGKSTLATSLAVAAMEAGERVFMLDMDPQRSLVSWATMRDRDDLPVEAVTAGRLAPTLAALEKNGFTLAIIDTPGVEGAASVAAMKAADLNIIPARPNAFDLWASETTRKALKEHRADFAFALNQCPPAQQTTRVEQGAEALEAMGGLITPLILTRVDYQEASRAGLGVTEWNESGAAAAEMKAMWSSIKRRLARRAKSAPARKAA
ncbi:chromosome partitioning protein [Rhizobiales bacterium GAS113]|jgi:chromosome partitioning protein|nr:chromosome partitioning protein [Rhizobiales bacterium GAS113]